MSDDDYNEHGYRVTSQGRIEVSRKALIESPAVQEVWALAEEIVRLQNEINRKKATR